MKSGAAFFGLFISLAASAFGAAAPRSADDVEREVRETVASRDVTIVHFWAPWCSNCAHEFRDDGWTKFVKQNPGVKIVFLNIWHKGQSGAAKLSAASLAGQPNLILIDHPNASNSRGEKLERFLGLPLGWVPTTWVYRDGKLRYAINYGEVRFDMLQQMVNDAAASW